jgi:hypothetical protein
MSADTIIKTLSEIRNKPVRMDKHAVSTISNPKAKGVNTSLLISPRS